MTGRTHDLAAFTALSLAAVAVPLPEMTLGTVLVAILANQIGGLAPDLDEPTAPLWDILPIGAFLGRMLRQMLGGHRFISHSLLGVALFGFLWHFLGNILRPSFPQLDQGIIWWAFMLGLASHLIMDALTKHGIPLFLPIPLKIAFPPVEALRVTTGSWVEQAIVFPGLLLLNVYLFTTYHAVFLNLLQHHLR
jgi:inner membrane protein